ncbi:G1/S-specific cyclin-E isoform X2 [Planococcus citri]|uniref:G1/S-specific cyclin-E isoform X2 n=1 Tax=Planococcus citri TaxID=170843 RepID=UPI0031F733D5
MNRNPKRRRSSDSDEEDNSFEQNEKKEVDTEWNDKVISELSSPVREYEADREDEPSSKVFHSDQSECMCDDCATLAEDDQCKDAASETEPDLHAFEYEDEGKDFDTIILSPNSNAGYSSCDERVLGSELSRAEAESLIASDYEDDDLSDAKDEPEDKPRKSGDAISFMGQLTPGSSVSKIRSRTPDCPTWTSFRKMTICNALCPDESTCPVPQLSWANREKFWEVMCRKDELSLKTRNADLFDYQQFLRPRMRVILLDWISEVAEVFKLHRETYYLTVDYIDRYLTNVPNIPKQHLQLIGITCLVLASKMEEIYPPKIDQFANVTDGACTEEEIFSMEVTILKNLGWLLSPITINNWLEMMLQFIYQKLGNRNKNILVPHFSSTLFKRLCQLLDLVTLDITSLRFSYGVLAASAIYILVDPNLAVSSSGLKKEILEPCVQWMSVYWAILQETYTPEMVNVRELIHDCKETYFGDQHPELQTHNISMSLYDLAQTQFDLLAQKESMKSENNAQILTPPPSSSKSIANPSDTPC